MKLHVSIRVEDFEVAIRFYTRMFDQDPMIRKPNYAKWDVEDPAVNFVIEAGRGEGRFDHLGIQVETQDELDLLADRMRGAGRPFLDVEKTTCCYAKSDKAWVMGEAGERWEVFLTRSHDEAEYGEDREHLLDTM